MGGRGTGGEEGKEKGEMGDGRIKGGGDGGRSALCQLPTWLSSYLVAYCKGGGEGCNPASGE